MKLGKNQQKWLNALKSGKYNWCLLGLGRKGDDGSAPLHTALGIAVEIFGLGKWRESLSCQELTYKTGDWETEGLMDYNLLGLNSTQGHFRYKGEDYSYDGETMGKKSGQRISIAHLDMAESTPPFQYIIYVIKNFPEYVFNKSA